MKWDVEYTNEFEDWWDSITEDEQDSVASCIPFLERMGPAHGRPLVNTVKGSRYSKRRKWEEILVTCV